MSYTALWGTASFVGRDASVGYGAPARRQGQGLRAPPDRHAPHEARHLLGPAAAPRHPLGRVSAPPPHGLLTPDGRGVPLQGSVAGLRGPRKGASTPSNPRPAAGLHTTAAGQRRQRTHLWGTALTEAPTRWPRVRGLHSSSQQSRRSRCMSARLLQKEY